MVVCGVAFPTVAKEKRLTISTRILVVTLFLLIISLVFNWWVTSRLLPEEYAPLYGYTDPQQVQGVEFSEDGLPVYSPGDFVHVAATKCNALEYAIPVEGKLGLARVGEGNRIVRDYITAGSGIRESGCQQFDWDNPLPLDLPPGIWRFEGIETATSPTGEKIQAVPLISEPFRVR